MRMKYISFISTLKTKTIHESISHLMFWHQILRQMFDLYVTFKALTLYICFLSSPFLLFPPELFV